MTDQSPSPALTNGASRGSGGPYRSEARRLAPQIFLSVFSFAFLIIGGAAGYRAIEGWSWIDSLFMVVISITTVGYGEVHPLSAAGRLYSMVVILGGMGVVSYVLLTFSRTIFEGVVEGSLRRALTRRRVNNKILTLSQHTIVCGFGRFGRRLGRELALGGRAVVVIDVDPGRAESVEEAGHLFVLGDAGDESVLVRAGVRRAQSLAIGTPNDAMNTYIVLAARELNEQLTILSRASDIQASKRLTRAGADRTLSPIEDGGMRMASMLLRPAVVDFLDLAQLGDFEDVFIEQLRVGAGSALQGKSLREGAYGSSYGVTVLALKPRGSP